jgi:hypothetical protein
MRLSTTRAAMESWLAHAEEFLKTGRCSTVHLPCACIAFISSSVTMRVLCPWRTNMTFWICCGWGLAE